MLRSLYAIKSLLLSFLALTLSSCSGIFFGEFSVTECEWKDDCILIQFSDEVERLSFERSLSVTKDGTPLSVNAELDGRCALVSSVYGFEEPASYKLQILSSCESVKGLSMRDDFINVHLTRNNSEPPHVISCEPKDGSECREKITEVEIDFSKPMNVVKTAQSLSVSPSFQYAALWNEENTSLILKCLEPLKENTLYKITVSSSAKDSENLFLNESYSFVFINEVDKEEPFLLSCGEKRANQDEYKTTLVQEGINHISRSCELELLFSKQIQKSSLSGAVYLTPNISFSVEVSDEDLTKATLRFVKEPDWGTETALTICDSLSALNGKSLANGAQFRLAFDLEEEKNPEFITSFLSLNESECLELSEKTNYKTLVFDYATFPLDEDVSLPLYLVFSLNERATSLDLKTLLKGVSFSVTNSCLSLYASSIEIVDECHFRTFENNICVVKLKLVIQNELNNGILRMNISSSIKDNLGNCLLEPLSLAVNKK